ncbi:hypothetical protein [Aquibacillus kalidii]|uniref:hypothetical protein n=1 Tax=Aquibacillus kalidii TaxID=2762597 RepID=UPI001C9A0698|nr:hypothetical protein [Aquibacillus kalidii]
MKVIVADKDAFRTEIGDVLEIISDLIFVIEHNTLINFFYSTFLRKNLDLLQFIMVSSIQVKNTLLK